MSRSHPLGWQPSEPIFDPPDTGGRLQQDRYWWDRWGWKHRICAMEASYLLNVLDFLEREAVWFLWREASDGELAAAGAEGPDPLEWVRATPLYRALERGFEGPPPLSASEPGNTGDKPRAAAGAEAR